MEAALVKSDLINLMILKAFVLTPFIGKNYGHSLFNCLLKMCELSKLFIAVVGRFFLLFF